MEVEAINSRGCYSPEWLSVEPFALKEPWAHMETQQFPRRQGDRTQQVRISKKDVKIFQAMQLQS